jgi:hypothetical protein
MAVSTGIRVTKAIAKFVLSYSNAGRHQCCYSNASKKKYAILRLPTDDTKDHRIVLLQVDLAVQMQNNMDFCLKNLDCKE